MQYTTQFRALAKLPQVPVTQASARRVAQRSGEKRWAELRRVPTALDRSDVAGARALLLEVLGG